MIEWKREKAIPEQRAADLLQPLMPRRSARIWLERHRIGNPALNTVVLEEHTHYFASEIFRIAKLLAPTPADANFVALRLGLDRRGSPSRRGTRRSAASPSGIGNRRTGDDRRQAC